MSVFLNGVFEPVTDLSVITAIVRIIYIDEKHDVAFVIDLADPPRRPYAVGLEELRRSLASGDTKPVTIATPEFMLVLEDQLDEKAKTGRDEKWAIIAPLLDPDYPGQLFVRVSWAGWWAGERQSWGFSGKPFIGFFTVIGFMAKFATHCLITIRRWVLLIGNMTRAGPQGESRSFRVYLFHLPRCSTRLISDAFEWGMPFT